MVKLFYLLLRDFQGLQVVADNAQLLFKLDDFAGNYQKNTINFYCHTKKYVKEIEVIVTTIIDR